MMPRFCLLASLLSTSLLHADPLSQADREALIEKLDSLSENAQETAMSRIGSAAAAIKAGMASDEAAINLYLKCIEKVNFVDRDRSTQDFREWKRREAERLKDERVGRSYRHQLRWLMLTLEAAEAGGKYEKLAPKALEAMESIFGNPKQFGDRVDILREPVTTSIFARAYNLGNTEAEEWPLSPLQIEQVFNQVILPPLREERKFDAMREQWKKRIRFEGIACENWIPEGRDKGEADRVAEAGKFPVEVMPELQWQMEMNLYQSGDQKRSALNMLDHLEANLSHSKARDWAGQFRNLIDPPDEEKAPAATAGPVAE